MSATPRGWPRRSGPLAPAERRPTVSYIPAGRPFVDRLAAGLLARHGDDPLAFARVTVLLPTRRAVRSLREAFLRVADGRALILPRLTPLGDVDEDELTLTAAPGDAALDLAPAMAELRRQLLLTRLLLGRPDLVPQPAHAARLARDLAGLLDEVETEGLDLARLDRLVPDEFAGHWQETLTFLAIIRETWPTLLAAEGALDPVDRRNRLIAALAARWAAQPPPDPVYAAGSTGSIPATAALLAIIARAPRGEVVLPGFDPDFPAAALAALRDDPCHPQAGMQRLLDRLGVGRDEVVAWQGEAGESPRARLLNEALAPASETHRWRELAPVPAAALAGLSRLEAAGPREEATAIALMLREALETAGQTAALITPDRALARRVAAELRRWDVTIDDSAGRPLAHSPPGLFLRLLIEACAEDLAPVPLLALLKHPLTAAGLDRAACRRLARRLERKVLRGPRPAPGIHGLRVAVARLGDEAELPAFVDRLEAALKPLLDLMALAAPPLKQLVEATTAAAEALAGEAGEKGEARLWAGDAGEALSGFLQELGEAADVLPELPGLSWPPLLTELLSRQMVRPRQGAHPRLAIYGLLEARLQQADLLILGGLNEGTWPPEAEVDPWLSRPMRARFGLPPLERRVGLTAHDFVQAAAAGRVVLSRAIKVGGTPTVPSRWLARLETRLADAARWKATLLAEPPAWVEALDRPAAVAASPPPRPRPPLAARPRELSVTRIETLRRDPYAIFAEYILKLRALRPLDEDAGAAERGTRIHKALDDWARAHPGDALPADALPRLIAAGEEALADIVDRPTVRAFWLPRFRRIAAWFLEFERGRRQHARTLATELKGTVTIAAPAGPFVLKGTADRIDRLADGRLSIVDYKTGRVPSVKEVESFLAPQLPLEAAMARRGAFPGIAPADVAELLYVRMTGGDPPGEALPVQRTREPIDVTALAEEAFARCEALIAEYDAEATAYLSRPIPELVKAVGDYDHLARVAEWGGFAGWDEDA
ncbi:MAG: double-strand break repair protein AddB [Alphaproteobacteria bacterium]|nr:double-strand break repair protein AddB [Alphaproteobacteria bacterium]